MTNKSNIIQILASIVIVLLAVGLSYYINNKKLNDSINEQIFRIERAVETYQDEAESLLFVDTLRIKSSGMVLNKEIYLFTDENDSILLQDVFDKNESILFFRYTELNCQICVDNEILLLKKWVAQSQTRLIILSSYESIRDLYLFVRTNQIPGLEIYNLKNQKLGLPLERFNTPYYFMSDSSLKAARLFIPEKSFPERSKVYFRSFIKE